MDPHWPWGAFVLGHHLEWLSAWIIGQWGVQDQMAEGRLTAPAQLPAEFEELRVACSVIAGLPGVDVPSLANLVGAANRFTSTCEKILFELQNISLDIQQVDLDAPMPPVIKELVEIEALSQIVFRSAPELRVWKELGAFIGKLSPNWEMIPPNPSDSSFATFVKYCNQLNSEGDFGFLEDLEALADGVKRHGTLCDLWSRVELGWKNDVIDSDRLAIYLKTQLWGHEPYVQYFELSADRLRLFDQNIDINRFGKPNTALLWVLCENRRTLIDYRYVIEQANLPVSPVNFKTYVWRLRKKLRPLAARGFNPFSATGV